MSPIRLRLIFALCAGLLVMSACDSDTAAVADAAATSASTSPNPDPDLAAAGRLSVDPGTWVLEAIGPNARDGDLVALSDHIGKPLVVTFFGPDAISDQDLAAKRVLADELGDQVTWIGIAIGEPDEIADSIQRNGIDEWPLATDLGDTGLLLALNGRNVPSTAFYDIEGNYLGLQPTPLGEAGLRSGLYQLYGLGDAPAAAPAGYGEFREQPTACAGERPDALEEMQFDAPADQGLSGVVTGIISTSCGDIELALDADAYPETVNSFVFLARSGYFDGVACHRLVPGFVLQCGDQSATGTTGPGYTVPDEFPESDFTYGRGVVAMANAGPGTTGSQFFIVIGDASFLDPAFSVLGNVVGSEYTLDALHTIPLGLSARGEESVPLETLYITGVEITD